MTNCHKCKTHKDKSELIGANVFDAVTGSHIITRWYCVDCAIITGLLVHIKDKPAKEIDTQ